MALNTSQAAISLAPNMIEVLLLDVSIITTLQVLSKTILKQQLLNRLPHFSCGKKVAGFGYSLNAYPFQGNGGLRVIKLKFFDIFVKDTLI